MTTALDTKLRAAALRILAKYGQSPTSYLQASPGDFDIDNDRRTIGTTERATGLKLAPPQVVTEGLLRGLGASSQAGEPLIALGDAVTYMAAQGAAFTPRAGDRITFAGIGNDIWEVIRVTPLVSGDQVAAWALIVRTVSDGTGG